MKTVIKSVYLIAALSLPVLTSHADNTGLNDNNASTDNTNTPTSNTNPTDNTNSTGNMNTNSNTNSMGNNNSSNTNSTSNTSSSTTNNSTTSFLGDYQCQRMDSSNNNVTNSLNVSKSGDTYTLQWENSNGDPILYGTGVMHPNMTNVVASSFWDPRKPDNIGIQMIEIKPDGSLQSNWIVQSDNQLGSETCTRNK
ncbi:Uncharacterised protein [Legionella wadsworthii]|uniref:Secreted protein n=1 Tax=Legionella wadsworthii TaxID=28088 RepID=A0A378LS32_9GAMM|nr:hypothetical protein [Legionella wadsworthii]STY28642.1 Uncharacterised protein [Legionella wadsworthii]